MEQTLCDLIAISSQSGSEQQILLFVADWLKRHGLTISRQSVGVATFIKGKRSDRCLILNGHVDTVGPGNLNDWATDPLTPKKIAGKIYGLGASDMKSGVAVLMELADYFSTHTPACDLCFMFVGGEEIDGAGTRQLVKWFQNKSADKRYKTIEAVIAEPTGLEKVEIGHRGNQFVKIAVNGHSGHAAFPLPGDSAILLTSKIIMGLQDLQKSWIKQFKDSTMGSPSIAVTGLRAGDFDAPNQIAGESIIQLDIRTLPEMHDAAPDLLNKFLATLTDKAKVVSCESALPGFTDDSSRLRRTFQKLYPKLPQEAMVGSSDICFFVNSGIPAIIFGPGQKETIHNKNEYMIARNLGKCFEIMKEVIEGYGS